METSSTERFCFLKKPASAAAHSGTKTTAAEGYAIRTVSAASAAEAKKTTSKQIGQLAVHRFFLTKENHQQTNRPTRRQSFLDHFFSPIKLLDEARSDHVFHGAAIDETRRIGALGFGNRHRHFFEHQFQIFRKNLRHAGK